jgi:hypothetical protein
MKEEKHKRSLFRSKNLLKRDKTRVKINKRLLSRKKNKIAQKKLN